MSIMPGNSRRDGAVVPPSLPLAMCLLVVAVPAFAAAAPTRLVIKGEDVLGFFDSLDEALSAGGARFGLSSFLVRRAGEQQETIDIPALTLGLLR